MAAFFARPLVVKLLNVRVTVDRFEMRAPSERHHHVSVFVLWHAQKVQQVGRTRLKLKPLPVKAFVQTGNRSFKN